MSEVPAACPGVESKEAGTQEACEGCPNQNVCKEGNLAVDPDIARIAEKLNEIKEIIVILSGKGGVGKSTVASQLAFSLSEAGHQVGLLDVDVCGPSIPRIMGVMGEAVHRASTGWCPVYVHDRLAVMSTAFLLASDADAVVWRGPKKNTMIKQFLRDVDWGPLDYLVIDTPPGTSDEHISLCQYISGLPARAVVVTTPQEVALADVRKELDFCNKVGLPVSGIVENMSGFICRRCDTRSEIFPATSGGGARLAADYHTKLLGSIPLDPLIAKACDEGTFYADMVEASPDMKVIWHDIVTRIVQS